MVGTGSEVVGWLVGTGSEVVGWLEPVRTGSWSRVLIILLLSRRRAYRVVDLKVPIGSL